MNGCASRVRASTGSPSPAGASEGRIPRPPLVSHRSLRGGDPIKLRIVPATRAWQRAVFDQAVASLEKPRSVTPQELQPLERSRRQALETLRFLGTPDALREL